jgi:hypothetical protein
LIKGEDVELENEVKTSWRIPKELLKEVKHLSTDMEISVTNLVVQALQDYVSKHKSKKG